MKKTAKNSEFPRREEQANKYNILLRQAIGRAEQLTNAGRTRFRAGDEEGFLECSKAASDEMSKALDYQAKLEAVYNPD